MSIMDTGTRSEHCGFRSPFRSLFHMLYLSCASFFVVSVLVIANRRASFAVGEIMIFFLCKLWSDSVWAC